MRLENRVIRSHRGKKGYKKRSGPSRNSKGSKDSIKTGEKFGARIEKSRNGKKSPLPCLNPNCNEHQWMSDCPSTSEEEKKRYLR